MYRDYNWKFALIIVMCFFAFWATAVREPNLGLDLKGGTRLVYSLDLQHVDPDRRSSTIEGVIEGLQRRIDIQGTKEVLIYPAGDDQIVVQLPHLLRGEEERVKNILQTSGKLEFKELLTDEYQRAEQSRVPAILERKRTGEYQKNERENLEPYDVAENPIVEGAGTANPQRAIPEYNTYEYLVVRNPKPDQQVAGDDLVSAASAPDMESGGGYLVYFNLDADGGRSFYRLTKELEGQKKPLAIVLDGKIVSAPNVESAISTSGRIQGRFSREQANDLVIVLKSGALPSKPIFQFEDKVGALLGQQAQKSGLMAMAIGFIVVVIFMIYYYRGAGIVADIALLVNLLLLWGVMLIFNFTLTLPGFAGILLTVGMAVDANILIFERMREETLRGVALRQAVEAGFDRAFWTIFDSNVTTLLTGAILYIIGTGPIKGFALTLCIGILTSMFSALFVSKVVFGYLVATERIKELNFARLIGDSNIDFMKRAKGAVAISIILIVAGFATFVMRGDEKYGIDFTGGTEMRVNFNRPIAKNDLAAFLASVQSGDTRPFAGADIQSIGEAAEGKAEEFLIRTRLAGGGDTFGLNALQERIEDRYAADLAPLDWGHWETGEQYKIFHNQGSSGPGWVEVYASVEAVNPADTASVAGYIETRLKRDVNLTASVDAIDIPGSVRFKHIKVIVNDDEPSALRAQEIYDLVQRTLNSFTRAQPVVLSNPFPLKTTIGPAVANVLKNKALLAIIASLIGIVLYITFRFELRFAIAAILALVHDVLITLGATVAFDLIGLDMKISLPIIAALLTIIGYSLNDTIVVYDRIRENVGKRKKGEPMTDIVNSAVNQTLSRTVLTSGTTLLAVLSLYIFSGVGVIEGLSLALMVGIVVGTYSSVFVASAVITADWRKARNVVATVAVLLLVTGLYASYKHQSWPFSNVANAAEE